MKLDANPTQPDQENLKPSDSRSAEDNMLTHNHLDSFFTEALMNNKPDWDMETIRTAALICSNALLLNNGYPKAVTTDKWVDEFLDKIGREVAVMGLHNYGYGVSIQKYLAKEGSRLVAYIEERSKRNASHVTE